jgi:hypothetical protein
LVALISIKPLSSLSSLSSVRFPFLNHGEQNAIVIRSREHILRFFKQGSEEAGDVQRAPVASTGAQRANDQEQA